MNLELITRFVLIFSSLFVIVEPFGVIPTFLSLTKAQDERQTRHIALKATVFGALVLVFFSLFGNLVFQLLQLNLSAFKAAGGVLLFLTALDMLRAKSDNCRCSAAEMKSSAEGHDVSYVPIGTPLLAGPGAITSVMVFSRDHSDNHSLHFLVLLLAIVIVFIISYFVFRFSIKIKSLLGESGMTVIQRMMGLILAALSLQFIFDGSLALIKQGLG